MGGFMSVGLRLCFPEDATVITQEGERKCMKDLKIGDKVLTVKENGKLKYESVYEFLHRDVNKEAEFIDIKLSNGDNLVMTGDHLVFRNTLDYASPARLVEAGETLFTVDAEHGLVERTLVESVSKRIAKGCYAPATFSGRLVVNNTLVSCYVELDESVSVNNHALCHKALKPLRMKAKMVGCNTKRTYRDEYVNTYCKVGFTIATSIL